MLRTYAHRRLLFVRLLVLGMIALGLMLQPVLAAAGEMHALTHDASGMHDHDFGKEALDADLLVTGEQDEGNAKTLHAMLHFAHCCGATAALLPVLKPISPAPLDRLSAIAETPLPPQARLTSLFKPPISG